MARKRGITTLPGAGVNIEYSQDGTTYNEVPGCDNFDIPQGERESRTTRAFGGTRASTGGRDVADVTINVVAYNPAHPVHQAIRDDYDDNKVGHWRIETEPQSLTKIADDASKNSITISAAGVLAFEGDSPDFTGETIQEGHIIVSADTTYIISKIDISEEGAATVTVVDKDGDPITAAVAKSAAGYEVWNPGLQWTFSGQGKNIGQAQGGVDADVGSTIVVTPGSAVAKPKIIIAFSTT